MKSMKSTSSKTSTKGRKNTANVRVADGMLSIRLPRELSRELYGVDQKCIALGRPDTELNRKWAESKCAAISVDIAVGNFDMTLDKYDLGVIVSNKKANASKLTVLDGGKQPQLSLLELYDKYIETKKGNVAETYFQRQLRVTFRNAVIEAVKTVGMNNALEIRNWLINNRSKQVAKQVLSLLSYSCQLGIKHNLCIDNPYEGMAEEIKIKKGQQRTNDIDSDGNDDQRAFTPQEVEAIIHAFETSVHRKHLAPIIKFLFWTGCRTGEAIGMKWRDINWDKEVITFRRTYSSICKLFKATKTGVIRWFPIPKDGELWELLKSLPQGQPDDLVFPSKTGKVIDARRLHRIWCGLETKRHPGVIRELIAQGKVNQYLTLYATRHTFISHQVNIHKVPITTVAQWVGNGAMVSNNSYLDRDRLTVPGGYDITPQHPTPPPADCNDKLDQLNELLSGLSPEEKQQLISKLLN